MEEWCRVSFAPGSPAHLERRCAGGGAGCEGSAPAGGAALWRSVSVQLLLLPRVLLAVISSHQLTIFKERGQILPSGMAVL